MGQSDSSKPSLFYLRGMAQKHSHKSAYACAFQHGSINPTPALYLLQAKMTSIEGLLASDFLFESTMKSGQRIRRGTQTPY